MVGIEDPKASTKPPEESTRAPISPDERFAHAPFDPVALFSAASPLEAELGTGKGRFLIESGRLHPERNFLGLERSLSYYRIARDRIRKSGLTNVRVLRADASEFVREAPGESVEGLHVYFPDPWPKKKQRKRRLIDAVLLSTAFRMLRAGGSLRIVTDHADYAAFIRASLDEAIGSGAAWEESPWGRGEVPPPTHYELKYRQAGREFFRFHLQKPR